MQKPVDVQSKFEWGKTAPLPWPGHVNAPISILLLWHIIVLSFSHIFIYFTVSDCKYFTEISTFHQILSRGVCWSLMCMERNHVNWAVYELVSQSVIWLISWLFCHPVGQFAVQSDLLSVVLFVVQSVRQSVREVKQQEDNHSAT